MNSFDVCWDKGHEAGLDGEDYTANPYPKGSEARRQWAAGWREGSWEPDDDRARQGLGLPNASEG